MTDTDGTRTSCSWAAVQRLAALLDMTPSDPTKVLHAACEALTGKRTATLAQAREIMTKALDQYVDEHG